MRTVGEILKNARLEQKLSFEEVEKTTKIRAKYLEAVEKNDFGKIPGGAPITKGFIRNYAQVLDLLPSQVLAIFRRDFKESKTGEIIPHGYYEPLNKAQFTWSPKFSVALGISLLVFSLGFYLFWQVFSYLGAPRLQVSYPQGKETVVKEPEVEVLGATDTDASVFVNGELVALDEKGNFRVKVSLSPGTNKIKFEAVSRRGKKTEVIRFLERESL